MDEVDGLRKRYNEAASWALIAEPEISQNIHWTVGKKDVRAVYGPKKDIEVVVSFEPLKVVLLRKGKEQVVLNGQGLLHLEHFRTKGGSEEIMPEDVPEEGLDVEDEAQKVVKMNPAAWFEGDSEDDWWEETFSSWTDSKPKGIYHIALCTPAAHHRMQAPSPCLWIFLSPITDTSTVFLNMRRDSTSPPPPVTLPPTPTPTVFTMPMSSNTTRHHPCHYTVPFPSCTHTLQILQSRFLML
jgi:hypothetical protein